MTRLYVAIFPVLSKNYLMV
jgi:hypothetical protein